MSHVRFNISDRYQCVSGDLHGSMTEPLIASLTAEPETIAEFESALSRYVRSESDWPTLHGFKRHEDLEPYDAGIVAIDLSSRTVGFDTTYEIPCSAGRVRVPGEFADEDETWIPYRVPDDWIFVESMPLYRGTRIGRSEDRLRRAPFDARPIVFGRPMIAYIARAISEAPDPGAEGLFADIHADWLMARRKDLRDRSPRDVFLEKQDFIDFDLQSRSLQWSMTKICPPALPKTSFAYLNAGFGTHEWVLYYDLFRYLLADAAERRRGSGGQVEIEPEILRLSSLRDEWLRTPDTEGWGRTPLDVIDLERQRINMTMSAEETLMDENCPCCVAMAADFDTPMFWFLDGCNMDDRFEFSSYETLEEWEANQREREKFDLEFERRYGERSDARQPMGREPDPF